MAKDKFVMAVSKKQLVANRRNAKQSTGPKTKQGKAVARRNAITHGLRSAEAGLTTTGIIINSPHLKEDARQYDHLLKSLFDELRPEGVLQEHLVIKIANCLWRYRRVINAETARIINQLETTADNSRFLSLLNSGSGEPDEFENDTDQPPQHDPALAAQSIPSGTFSLNLMHYEMRLDKQLSRAYKLLYHLQLMDEFKKAAAPPAKAAMPPGKVAVPPSKEAMPLGKVAMPPKRLPTHHSQTQNSSNEPICSQRPPPSEVD